MQEGEVHRKHAWWKDYKERGIYLITIVVRDKQHLFGELNMNVRMPDVVLSELGKAVKDEWLKTADIQQKKGRKIRLLSSVVMPDHFHGIIFVEERMDVGLGEVIRSFKVGCTQAHNRLRNQTPPGSQPPSCHQPSLADNTERLLLAKMSHKQRSEYYALHPELKPFFDDNYDDTICFRKGQLNNIIHYVQDNPRRAIMRKLHPDLFQRRQHIVIAGTDYSAYGNLFLLRRPWKEQVMCHRWKMTDGRRDYSTPFETTPEFAEQRDRWIKDAQDGAVIVTPAISKGEKRLFNDCIEQGLPLIHLQETPIKTGWNPEKNRHRLCEAGLLLIISPWEIEQMAEYKGVPKEAQYSKFHNMNLLAQKICNENLEIVLKQK